MEEQFKQETDGLERSWGRHDQEVLRSYLVQDVEDPRINIQSILTRHFLIERLFGERFAELMEQELRFGLVVNWTGSCDPLGTLSGGVALPCIFILP